VYDGDCWVINNLGASDDCGDRNIFFVVTLYFLVIGVVGGDWFFRGLSLIKCELFLFVGVDCFLLLDDGFLAANNDVVWAVDTFSSSPGVVVYIGCGGIIFESVVAVGEGVIVVVVVAGGCVCGKVVIVVVGGGVGDVVVVVLTGGGIVTGGGNITCGKGAAIVVVVVVTGGGVGANNIIGAGGVTVVVGSKSGGKSIALITSVTI
jgi:hypothetical protein